MEPKVEQTNDSVAIKQKKRFELPFHIVKRSNLPFWKKALIYAIALISAMVISALLCVALAPEALNSSKPRDVQAFFQVFFQKPLETERRIWDILLNTALLLGTSMALIPAFKMKFWNLGGNGQIYMGCFAAYACNYWCNKWFEGAIPEGLLLLLMLLCSLSAGILWALIPALFRAFFGTNETLFTLMMNYIAEGVVLVFFSLWIGGVKTDFQPVDSGVLPAIYNDSLPTVFVFFLLAILMFVYLKYSKHGYEISVVGESVNTAKYIGINVKKVIIRTLILSGAIAGLVGFFLIARTGNQAVSINSPNHLQRGFTAIMTSWLAGFNPLLSFLSCFFISFTDRGMYYIQKNYGLTNDAIAKFVTGLIYFFVIACTFFINYKIVFRKKDNEKIDLEKKFANQVKGVK